MCSQSRKPYLALAPTVLVFFAFALCERVEAQPTNRAYYWSQVTTSASWTPRAGHAAVNFRNKLWVIGGLAQGVAPINDIWTSSDGRNWTLEANAVPWLDGRGRGRIVVFRDNLWVVGNYEGSNDVWKSPDGVNWTQVTPTAPWGKRLGAGITVFDEKLWVLGGEDTTSAADFNDVWNSSDGIQWTQVVEQSAWVPGYVNTIVFQNRLWVIGGYFPYLVELQLLWYWVHEVAYSSTGDSWTSVPSEGVGYFTALADFDNQLWDLDRSSFHEVFRTGTWIEGSNEVWRSQDAAHWQQMPNAPWTIRHNQGAAVFDGKLWILGGLSEGLLPCIAKNDVWNLTPVSLEIDTGQRFLYNAGDPMTLKLTASALSGAVQYQWLKNGNAIPDATSDTYHVDAFSTDDAGAYTCELTGDTFGSAGPVQIGLAPTEMPAGSPVCFALGVCLATTILAVRRRKSLRL